MKFYPIMFLAAVPLLFPISNTLALEDRQPRGAISQGSASLPVAQAQPGNPPRPREDRGPRWLEELDLSDEQSEQIQAIHEQSKASMESTRQQLQDAREQMRSLLAGNATAEQLRQQHQQIQALHQQLGDRRFETMLAVREILTPQQRAQMAELMEQRRGSRGRRPLR